VLRDIDILQDMTKLNLISVCFSIITLNRALARKMEPRTSSPERRLETIEKLTEKKIPAGVNIAPVIPGLTDQEIPTILKKASSYGAVFAGHSMLRLPYAVKDLFLEWLKKELPGKESKIVNKIREMRDGKLNESEFGVRFSGKGELAETIHSLFEISCRKYGLNQESVKLRTDLFRIPSNQLGIF
jgi:DNA repair photolyase